MTRLEAYYKIQDNMEKLEMKTTKSNLIMLHDIDDLLTALINAEHRDQERLAQLQAEAKETPPEENQNGSEE